MASNVYLFPTCILYEGSQCWSSVSNCVGVVPSVASIYAPHPHILKTTHHLLLTVVGNTSLGLVALVAVNSLKPCDTCRGLLRLIIIGSAAHSQYLRQYWFIVNWNVRVGGVGVGGSFWFKWNDVGTTLLFVVILSMNQGQLQQMFKESCCLLWLWYCSTLVF